VHVVAVALDLHIPSSRSLKEKRAVLRPVLDGIRHRYPVAVAETDQQDTRQRAEVGVAAVSASVSQLVEVMADVERFVWSFPELEVLDTTRRWLEDD
jgi:uncharacterized protein YlxP (DUF503 family)